jgi:hypothetical protein
MAAMTEPTEEPATRSESPVSLSALSTPTWKTPRKHRRRRACSPGADHHPCLWRSLGHCCFPRQPVTPEPPITGIDDDRGPGSEGADPSRAFRPLPPLVCRDRQVPFLLLLLPGRSQGTVLADLFRPGILSPLPGIPGSFPAGVRGPSSTRRSPRPGRPRQDGPRDQALGAPSGSHRRSSRARARQ